MSFLYRSPGQYSYLPNCPPHQSDQNQFVEGNERCDLTEREREILFLIAEGLTNKHIARRLGICDGTVKTHVRRIFPKIKARTRLEAAVWLLRSRIDFLEKEIETLKQQNPP
ncbi:LuxR C-terminal-related transcriptional regulator [Thiohalorhabdus sp. Cl-TMA]|uniref:LuxR C-terminal-related transcriptional regulator n=1 Tax=Thiohalorhabdus methylotrophus TaxID=3242694 RepID=A0ABV4TRU7_9GAMM